MRSLLRFALVFLGLATLAEAQNPPHVYVYDDGISETVHKIWGGPGLWGIACWIHGFTTVGASDAITRIDVAWGSSMFPNNKPQLGAACNVGVWSDPNQDGNPSDGILLHQQASTVMILGDPLQSITLTSPVVVSGKFFIGAWMACAPTTPQGGVNGEYPAAIDVTAGPNGNSWITGSGGTATGPYPFDPTNLSSPSHLAMTNPIVEGVYLLRAVGTDQPAPFCTAKGGLVCGPPVIGSTGLPSATAGSGFTIHASPARGCRLGILLYNTGQQTPGLPFQGGTLCIAPQQLRRAGPTDSGGTAGGCDGALAIDMNAFAQGAWVVPDCAGNPSGLPPNNPAPYLVNIGQHVYTQFWGRDSVATGSLVSAGLHFIQGP